MQEIFKLLNEIRHIFIPSYYTCSLGSETGGEDALVGNVNKLMVSPPGYSGALRKGHLVFDACFESGEYQTWKAACQKNKGRTKVIHNYLCSFKTPKIILIMQTLANMYWTNIELFDTKNILVCYTTYIMTCEIL